jgi:hypothetical protein
VLTVQGCQKRGLAAAIGAVHDPALATAYLQRKAAQCWPALAPHRSIAQFNEWSLLGSANRLRNARLHGAAGMMRRCSTCGAQYPPDFLVCPKDATALAEHLWRAWNGYDPVEEQLAMSTALQLLPTRRREFAEAYEDIVLALCTRTKA